MNILLTGGAGYIGTHTAIALLQAGHRIAVFDNFSNASGNALDRVTEITGQAFNCYEGDIRDRQALEWVVGQSSYDAVIHFAGLKAVGESVRNPLIYYDNNVAGTLTLCEVMERYGVRQMVFSSSATVYGDPQSNPIREDAPLGAVNPYGRTKRMVEEILMDVSAADPRWSVMLLRYFNPIGAHESGRIGESPKGVPNNLLPYIVEVAAGRQKRLRIFGNDYPTPDGTGIRDYIHVMDLAEGHVKAMEKGSGSTGCHVYNLGTGVGYSVLEVVRAFQAVSGVSIPCEVVSRRPGDAAVCCADPGKAGRELEWHARYSLEDMCRHAWRWHQNNPQGY